MMVQVTIRPATKTDMAGVDKVFTDELRHHISLLPERFQMAKPLVTADWYDEILANAKKVLLVAELNEKIVGLALVNLRSSPSLPFYRPRLIAELDELAVAEDFRGQGIGRQLMTQVREWAQSYGAKEIELDVWEKNTEAIRFYERLGYEKLRRKYRIQLGSES